MFGYIVRRILHMIPIILGVAGLVFVLFSTVGEDPVRIALGNHATPEAIELLRKQWGLDKSLFMQFLDFLWQIITLNFGRSYNTGESLIDMFARGAPVSLALTIPPFVIGTIIAVGMGLFISYYRGGFLDRFSAFLFIGGMSISYLAYIIGFQYIFAYYFPIFPINGYESGIMAAYFLMLPWIIEIIVAIGPDIRMYRTVFLDETKADYVRTARAKGCKEQSVLFKHVLKNAMIPIITYTVVAVPFLIMGAFLLERFFSLPGLGDMLITAVNTGDFPILKGMTVLIAIAYSVFNLITDVLYAYVDPRVSFK